MIPRTDFHCITTWVARSSGMKFGNAFTDFVVRVYKPEALLFNINIQTEYIFIARPNCAL